MRILLLFSFFFEFFDDFWIVENFESCFSGVHNCRRFKHDDHSLSQRRLARQARLKTLLEGVLEDTDISDQRTDSYND